jgi:hypothetical protein
MESMYDLEKLYGEAANGGLRFLGQQSMIINCPKNMVGRVIGKNGETIKALQQFTGAQIQIDQRCDPTRVSIAGPAKAMQMATSMVQDIVAGTFKGFAMLRSHATQANKAPAGLEFLGQPAPVYIEGYGFIPPSQFGDPIDPTGAFPPIQGYNTDQANQASLNALSSSLAQAQQLYGLPSVSPQHDTTTLQSGASQNLQQLNSLQQQLSQNAQMSNIARSLFEKTEVKHPEEMVTSTAQSLGMGSSAGGLYGQSAPQTMPPSAWAQTATQTPSGSAVSKSPLQTPANTPSGDSSPTTAAHRTASASPAPDQGSLAAQLQALSLMASFQSQQSGQSGSTVATPSAPEATAPTPVPQPTQQQPLPQGWIQLTDPENRVLFHNFITGHTQYHHPVGGNPQAGPTQAQSSGPATPTTANPNPVQATLHQILSSTDPKGGSQLPPSLFH